MIILLNHIHQKKKAISLIVLVITIIVMVIIASVIIISLTNSNIIKKSNEAVTKTNDQTIAEAAILKYAQVKLDIMSGDIVLENNQTIGDLIEYQLKADKIIPQNEIIFINDEGGVEQKVEGVSQSNGGIWGFDSQNAIITGYDGEYIDNLVIPNVIDNIKVLHIGTGAFSGYYKTGLKISYGIKTIGYQSFAGSSLTSIIIPNSVTIIEGYAFAGSHLKTIKLPNSIKTIKDGTFTSSSLTSIEIPKGVTTIGQRAFALCYSLEEIIIPESTEEIGEYAFEYCDQLTSIKINKKLHSISGSPWDAPGGENVVKWLK